MKYAGISAAAVKYMADKMAMPDTSTDQEQNWILGHMVTFVRVVEGEIRADEREKMRDPFDRDGWAPVNRDELIEKMCVAAFNDQGELGWENCRKAGNKSLGLVRERMARVLDVVESELRAGGIEAGRALVALHAAVARKEGRAEGLRMALETVLANSCGNWDEIPRDLKALIAKTETGE